MALKSFGVVAVMLTMALGQEATTTTDSPVLSILKVYDDMPDYHFASALGADDVATTVMIDCESACSYWPDAIVTQGPSTFHGRFVMDSQQVIWDCTANGTTPGSPATCIVWTGLEFNKTKTLTLPEPQTVVIPDPTYYPVSITAGPLTPWTQATSINITVTAINRPETDSVVETGSITITGIPTQSSSTSATTTGSGSPVSSKDASGANQREVALAGSLGGLVLALIAYL